MPPTNPWGKKKPQEVNTSSPGPGVKPSQHIQNQKSQYEEIQEDELLALSAIYGEDFQRIEKHHTAWKVP
jgi:translation initiation factor 2-alpha kinase 4